jgi:hypothetical protein
MELVREMTLAGKSAREIALRIGRTMRSVERYRRSLGLTTPVRRWTPEEIEIADGLLDDGCTYREVAATVGRSPASVFIKFPRRGNPSNCSVMVEAHRLERELGLSQVTHSSLENS